MSPAEQLQSKVQTALEQNPHVSSRFLRFETSADSVTLRGVVPSFYHKQMAQEALRRVDGVATIENKLEVSWR